MTTMSKIFGKILKIYNGFELSPFIFFFLDEPKSFISIYNLRGLWENIWLALLW